MIGIFCEVLYYVQIFSVSRFQTLLKFIILQDERDKQGLIFYHVQFNCHLNQATKQLKFQHKKCMMLTKRYNSFITYYLVCIYHYVT
jgi:hypothetical protein